MWYNITLVWSMIHITSWQITAPIKHQQNYRISKFIDWILKPKSRYNQQIRRHLSWRILQDMIQQHWTTRNKNIQQHSKHLGVTSHGNTQLREFISRVIQANYIPKLDNINTSRIPNKITLLSVDREVNHR
jgi:uncharacterized membrane protein YheB (UPF0754 family)